MTVLAPGSVLWLARHEFRLAWRDWRSMITAGNRRRFSRALIVLALVALILHLPAWAIVTPYAGLGTDPDVTELASVSVLVVLYFSLLLSQSLEQVTRTLYSRGDLDLVLSSPIAQWRLFAVRIASNAALTSLMALVLSAPFVNVLSWAGGPRWLAAYAVAIAVAVLASSLAVIITIGLFRLLGPRRTRVVAQVVTAVVGSAFAIGIQVTAIINYGKLTQMSALVTPELVAALPGADSPVWLPARAILGNLVATAIVAALALAMLAAVIATFAPRLGEHSMAATDLATPNGRQGRSRPFAVQSPRWAMRRKEWLLLRRDPWLVSQTLTQLLYLIPPALLLMHSLGDSAGAVVITVMVLVTVGGQLGGALGWLAISGEDAPEFVATAPLRTSAVVRGKVEAVLGAVFLTLGPLILLFALVSPTHAAFAAAGIVVAAVSTVQIQLWFRAQARRSQFRRRHTSSRIATLAEAMVSFSWAAAFGFASTGTWFAAISGIIALVILFGVRAVSPRRAVA